MCSLDQLRIDLMQVNGAPEERKMHLTDDFFEAVGATEVSRGDVDVTPKVSAVGSSFRVDYSFCGTLVLPCDICLDDMAQPVEGSGSLVVRLGKEPSEDGDTIVIDENEGMLDMAWYVYESIALSIPIRHVHETGKCNVAMTELTREYIADSDGERAAARSSDEEQDIDPRWAKLKDLNI